MLQLHPHQQQAVDAIVHYKSLLLLFKVGSGKTAAAGNGAENLLSSSGNTIKSVDIVAPKSVHGQWTDMVRDWNLKRVAKLLKIWTYEGFAKEVGKNENAFLDSFLVLDEAQQLGQSNTQRSKSVLSIYNRVARVVLLSGTPVRNEPSNMSIMFKIMNPSIYTIGIGAASFYSHFGENGLGGTASHEIDINDSHYKFLQPIAQCNIFYYAPDVNLEDYPIRLPDQEFLVQMSPVHDRVYVDLFKTADPSIRQAFLSTSGGGEVSKNFNAFLSKAQLVSNMYKSDKNLIMAPKISMMFKIVKKQLDAKLRVLIYSSSIPTINFMSDLLNHRKIPFKLVSGTSGTAAQRAKDVNDFNTQKANVMMVSIAGGTGIDLKGVNAVHIMEPHWVPEEIDQVIGRAFRYGSHKGFKNKTGQVFHYYAHGTILEEQEYCDIWKRDKASEKAIINQNFVSFLTQVGEYKGDCVV